ncbi:MDR/zinc-dependent alcohol dehydrogenase-like family protein [Cohnella rhizosphaerae]|uniref:Uncharacterized protein n=1 Tax=Cohnella rhizosphaerae TaxID=1457232 RepID=A0A9X4KQQ6_9BACL|nr:hypothetical protein [Cohnella rhizosphaerae]MDG0809042.1 hypothetical protein [Cohnella rhizosphaerae]
MINQSIIFEKPWQVEVKEGTFVAPALAADEVVVKKLYTLISPGTELACLSGGESWFGLPGTPGYASVSEIVETGANERRWRQGGYRLPLRRPFPLSGGLDARHVSGGSRRLGPAVGAVRAHGDGSLHRDPRL